MERDLGVDGRIILTWIFNMALQEVGIGKHGLD
jgi:hypothetical protein